MEKTRLVLPKDPSDPTQTKTYTMAPKNLMKKLKYKPQIQLNLDDVKSNEKETLGIWTKPIMAMPDPTARERAAWVETRTLQRSTEEGQPVEGWPARIAAMKADGRLRYCDEDKLWHRRE